ncbi:MAG: MBL fold metallo-hydrolase [Microbacteriaceae bacterium]|nr:MBL fold metallo-hydrolase [Microbacteriaceae bacterium]
MNERTASPAPAEHPHSTLQFLGGAETVTGSKYLLTVGERRILVDVGMFQGEKQLRARNWLPFPFDAAGITDVLLTHAHMDHVGMLPRLVKQGFRGPVFATEGTVRLAEIVLRDGAKIQEQDARDANKGGWSKHSPALPLYTTEDVEATLPLFVTVPFDEDLDLDDGIVARYTRAGHILGSASITVWTRSTSVVFSGDLGRATHPVLKPRDAAPGAPYALIESTYGDREHPDPDLLPHEGFADVVRRTLERGGSVLVPAFAVDRTEVVLKNIAELRRDGRIPHCPVYVDSPMANLALDVYRSMPEELRDDLRPEELLEFPDLHSVRTPDESMALTRDSNRRPSIIVAASGMATGGRVLHHLQAMLPDRKNAVVLTGYQAVGTRGRQLVEGATKLKMHGEYVKVRAEVFQDSEFSVHGDGSDLLDWLRELEPRPRTVYCVHGEPDSANALMSRIEAELPGVDAIVPTHNEIVVLDGMHAVPESAPVPTLHPDRSLAPVPGARDAAAAPTAPAAAPLAAATAAITDYRLVTGADAAELSAAVTAALGEGYVPYGGPGIGAVDGAAVYLQALVRR